MKKRSYRKSLRQRNKLSARLRWIAGGTGISLLLLGGWIVYIHLQETERSKATGKNQVGSGGELPGGDILTEFNWENAPATQATLGPDGISVSPEAHSMKNGSRNSFGLSAGKNGKNIDLILPDNELFNQEGIDISIDYRGVEKDGDFISRGSGFRFGIEKGLLTIAYRTEDERGNPISIKAETDYEIPVDDDFRTYRFCYSPVNGRGEISVNGAPVWNHQGAPNRALYWKNAGRITIGKSMNGAGRDIAILDHLVIRTNGTISPLAETLLNFMVENNADGIRIHFSVTQEDLIQSYTIERSIDGNLFTKLAAFEPGESYRNEEEYMIADQTPNPSGVIYYRLKQQFKNGKRITHPLSAIKIKSDKGFSIERINPMQFDSGFSLSYFIPASGRVWMQLQDAEGKVVASQTFEAREGKNLYNFNDEKGLKQGTYTLNLMHNNRKVSAQVIKN